MKQSKKQEWEKRFYKNWYLWDNKYGDGGYCFTTCGEEVKSFISDLLAKERRKTEEMMEEVIGEEDVWDQRLGRDGYKVTEGYNKKRQEIIKIINKFKEREI